MVSCDAWLLPVASVYTGSLLSNSRVWLKAYFAAHPSTSSYPGEVLIAEKSEKFNRVARIKGIDPSWPTPYFVSVSPKILEILEEGEMNPVEWLCEGAAQFVELYMSEDFPLSPHSPYGRNGRDRPLLSLPVIGTGGAGQRSLTGLIVHHLLSTLTLLSQKYRVDLNLVTFDLPTFTLAQRLRVKEQWSENGRWFSSISSSSDKSRIRKLRKSAEKLAEKAKKGKLVLFIGAGVSVGAGLPSWGGLLDELAHYCGIDSSQSQWQSLDFLNKAELIQLRLKDKGERIGDHLPKFLDKPHHSLMHSLLAGLPSNQIVTTNYDVLFELAWKGIGIENVSILPYYPEANSEKWILKMHGCLTNPHDIVLTRNDYLRYMERHAALAGIVQSMLLVSHLFFVGFSLQDDNFHKIIHEVRKAVSLSSKPAPTSLDLYTNSDNFSFEKLLQSEEERCKSSFINRFAKGNSSYILDSPSRYELNDIKKRKKKRRIGTTTQLFENEFHQELWKKDLYFTNMCNWKDNPQKVDWASSARDLEIFLDYLLFTCTFQTNHILEERFSHSLSVEEIELREVLNKTLNTIALEHPSAVLSNGFDRLEELFHDLGLAMPYFNLNSIASENLYKKETNYKSKKKQNKSKNNSENNNNNESKLSMKFLTNKINQKKKVLKMKRQNSSNQTSDQNGNPNIQSLQNNTTLDNNKNNDEINIDSDTLNKSSLEESTEANDRLLMSQSLELNIFDFIDEEDVH